MASHSRREKPKMGAMANHPSYKHFTNAALIASFERLGSLSFDCAPAYEEIKRRGLADLDLSSKRLLFAHREALRLHFDPTVGRPLDSNAYLAAADEALKAYGPGGEKPSSERPGSLAYQAGYARLLFLKGDALSELGLYPEALAAFEESAARDPSDENEAPDRLAYLYLALGKKEALASLSAAFPTRLAPLFASALYEDIETEDHVALVASLFPRNPYFVYLLLGLLRPIPDQAVSLLGRKERGYLPSVEQGAYQYYALRASFPFFEEALASFIEKGRTLLPGGVKSFYALATVLSFYVFAERGGKRKRLTSSFLLSELSPNENGPDIFVKFEGREGIRLSKEDIASALDLLAKSRAFGLSPSGIIRYTAAADFLLGAILPPELQAAIGLRRQEEESPSLPPENKA